MCDYSLEMYKSRAAKADEDLTVRQFPSSSRGFIDPVDADCAVCLEPGVELILHFDHDIVGSFPNLDTNALSDMITIGGDMPVVFYEIEKVYGYRDGFRLADGHFVLLQALPVGTRATVTKPLPIELTEAVAAPVAFDPDTGIVPDDVTADDIVTA